MSVKGEIVSKVYFKVFVGYCGCQLLVGRVQVCCVGVCDLVKRSTLHLFGLKAILNDLSHRSRASILCWSLQSSSVLTSRNIRLVSKLI